VFFSLYYAVKHHIYSHGNETLINYCLLTFCSARVLPEIAEALHGGHVVYLIEHTDQFQQFGKTLARKYEFKNLKNLT